MIGVKGSIIIGALMMLSGWAVVFAMVLHLLESTFFLNFAAYLVSLFGVLLGLRGLLLLWTNRRRPEERRRPWAMFGLDNQYEED